MDVSYNLIFAEVNYTMQGREVPKLVDD